MAADREALARAIREARENRGMSQEAAAKRLRLSRTVLAQIELGNRRVSDDELERFAKVYEVSVPSLAGTEAAVGEDVEFTVSELAPELFLDEITKQSVSNVLVLVRLASSLEQRLERQSSRVPHFDVSAPTSAADAIAQGEDTAEQERRRLGLLSTPATNVVSLVASQGIRVAAAPLQDGLTCLFMRLLDVGSVIVVNSGRDEVQRRFAMLHAYAHVLFERGQVVRTAKRSNAGELIAKRATAFATAFLLPESGIRTVLEGLGKGQPSRKGFVVLDAATDERTRAERRTAPGSQAVTYADAAAIAGQFGASYKAVVLRLQSLGILSETQSDQLLTSKAQSAADQFLALTHPRVPHAPLPEDRSGLKADVLHLAIECYRRELLNKRGLEGIAELLQLPDLSEAKLLEFAQAAR
jgi:Zn-dependent peptidase ImmA (M78 family)/transcriptional regulator with XRE-family HTH domain